MNVKDRVRKHRAHLKEQCCGRLDIAIDVTLINQLHEMARFKGVPVWSAVRDALETHLIEFRQLLAEGQRLNREHARLLKLVGISEYQNQIAE